MVSFSRPPDDVWGLMQIKHSRDHQYVIVEGGVGTVGITNYAQEKPNEVITLSSRTSARKFRRAARSALSNLSRPRATSILPISGEILVVNEALAGKPELVNEDAVSGPPELLGIHTNMPGIFRTDIDQAAQWESRRHPVSQRMRRSLMSACSPSIKRESPTDTRWGCDRRHYMES
jgi:glycine cleavage system H protein